MLSSAEFSEPWTVWLKKIKIRKLHFIISYQIILESEYGKPSVQRTNEPNQKKIANCTFATTDLSKPINECIDIE